MARIFQDGFELGVPTGNGVANNEYGNSLWQSKRSGSVDSYHRMLARYSKSRPAGNYILYYYVGNFGNCYIQRDLGVDLREHYGRVEFNGERSASAGFPFVFFMDGTLNPIVQLIYHSGGEISIRIGMSTTTVALSNPNVLSLGTWGRIEWRILVDTVGYVEVRVNGVTVVSYEGNTKGTNGDVRFVCLGSLVSDSTERTYEYDDVAINDTTGTVNNSWCGKGHIEIIRPIVTGHHQQFTPSVTEPFNIIKNAVHERSSVYSSSHESHLALDELNTTAWVTNFGSNQWIMIKANVLAKANLLRLYGGNSGSGLKNFKLEGSNTADDTDWVTLVTGVLQSNDTFQDYPFANDVQYKFYKFWALDGFSTSLIYIHDIRLFESPTASITSLISDTMEPAVRSINSTVPEDAATFGVQDIEIMKNNTTIKTIRTAQLVYSAGDAGTGAKATPMLRIGVTDVEGTSHAVIQPQEGRQIVYEINPVTGLPWTKQDLTTLEIGLRHKA